MSTRRSLRSNALWMERFALLGDPQIGKAFADMVARPAAPHTVASLAECAYLSRSAFMARFSDALGQSPMQVLRTSACGRPRTSCARATTRSTRSLATRATVAAVPLFVLFATSMARARPNIARSRQALETSDDPHCLPDPL
ncbi:MAG: AraC family transcriptional regulator, activator of mtrCDE, partial [Caballeronia sp.]|nr:AraC family transcriptional regulator, activator of mtrCDE [Caballeronia sp.]